MHISTFRFRQLSAVLLAAGFSITALAAAPQDILRDAVKQISVADAAKHIGEKMQVCGDVSSTRYDRTSIGMPTSLLFGQGYPSTPPVFTVVIWSKDRGLFPWPPEDRYKGQRVCVDGTIEKNSKGGPEITATSPKQIEEKKKPQN
jgi:hypothetical protein